MLPNGKSSHNFNQNYAVDEETATDASVYCQPCIENENCATTACVDVANMPVGIYSTYDGTSYYGFVNTVDKGNQTRGQAGCVFVAENRAWGDGDYLSDINYG